MSTLNKQIWLSAIQDNIYAEWDKLLQIATDDTPYVEKGADGIYNTVYIPQAGGVSQVKINPNVYPLEVEERVDDILSYTLKKIVQSPIRVGHYESKLNSYDDYRSILNDLIGNIGEAALYETMKEWYIGKVSGGHVVTTGGNVTGGAPGATGNRKSFTNADFVKAVKTLDIQLNTRGVGERIAILPTSMFYELHQDLFAANINLRVMENDGIKMIEQPWLGCKIVTFPQVVVAANTGDVKSQITDASATTDIQVGLIVDKKAISVAKGDVQLFTNSGDATYQGDILSSYTWVGGKYRRLDKKGVVPILQHATGA